MSSLDQKYLFSDFDLDDVLRSKQKDIQPQVNRILKEQFLATPYDDLVEHIVLSNLIEPLTIYEDRMVASEPKECKVDVSGNVRRRIRANSRPFLVDGYEVRVEVPFSGDPNLWKCKTSGWTSAFPIAEIRFPTGEDIGKVVMTFCKSHDEDPERMKSELNENLDLIRNYVGWSKTQVDAYNQSLPQLAKNAINYRTDRLKKTSGITDVLGIPLKQKGGTPSFEPIKIQKKIVRPLPPIPKAGLKQEFGITDSDYETILRLLRHSGTSFEKTPKTFLVHDEEELRDILLSQLNALFEGKAKGEVFNKSGKTDILISEDGRSAFIAECKIWHGQKGLLETIDQLLGYLTWRDCKTAIVAFNKNNKDFSKILETIRPTVMSHPNYVREDRQIDENEWHFAMRSKDDETRNIGMRLMVFNLYCPGT